MTRRVTVSYGFRWSFYREPYSQVNDWTSWSFAAYNPSLPASDACNGIIIVPNTILADKQPHRWVPWAFTCPFRPERPDRTERS